LTITITARHNYTLPVETNHPRHDLRKIRPTRRFRLMTMTRLHEYASCRSAITFIDGDKDPAYRGYPIDVLASTALISSRLPASVRELPTPVN